MWLKLLLTLRSAWSYFVSRDFPALKPKLVWLINFMTARVKEASLKGKEVSDSPTQSSSETTRKRLLWFLKPRGAVRVRSKRPQLPPSKPKATESESTTSTNTKNSTPKSVEKPSRTRLY